MKKCEIIRHVVPADSRFASKSNAVCNTHSWTTDMPMAWADGRCPFGKLEDAIDAWAAKILAAIEAGALEP